MVKNRVTIVDVAKQAGVAISSASAALNNGPGVSSATRERILAVADDLGFVPSVQARSLSAKRAFAIGLVLERSPDVLEEDPFFAAFISGVEEALSPRGYALILHQGVDREDAARRYRELAANRRVDGVLVNEVLVDDWRVDLLHELGMPAVGVLPTSMDFPLPSVRQVSSRGISQLVEMLASLGHRNIAHVSGAPRFVHTHEREQAWRNTLRELGLPPGPLVCGNFSYEGGRRAADVLLGLDDSRSLAKRPTAVVCANDLSAVGLVIRAQELGYQVPRDLSVAGFDGIALGTYIRPTLTTVQTTPRLVGRAAADLLLDVALAPEGERVPDVVVPPSEMVIKDSTGLVRGLGLKK